MENKKQVVAGHGSSSLDHLFGPKDVSSSTSSTTGLFGTIFPLPSAVLGKEKKRDLANQVGSGKNEKSENVAQSRKGESSGVTSKDSIYQNYQTAEPCYFSSSIYYGGQENYSPRTSTTHESQHIFKKDGSEDDSNGNNSNSALRGNWWQGKILCIYIYIYL
ncbi:hypothetical protein PanWU01x14_180980 [Parasponia andersonii]|uniref:Uncharacterized protein n=1 Tax=Parasponia andersonii TaxID=3476 RepID=A0A2P5C625_PARAD|nr:hypothetical protein PanWU01x14_180980 [Parasponia andersonii]